MIEIIKELKIEVSKPNIFQAVVAKQYDMNTRFIKATLVDGTDVVRIPSHPTVKAIINAERPDGLSKGFDGEVNSDGTVTVPLHSWMLEMEGTVICDISIIDTAANDNKKLTTTAFTLLVEKAAYGGGDVTNDPQYDVLVTLLETCQEASALAEDALQKSNEANSKYDACVEATENANAAAEELESIKEELAEGGYVTGLKESNEGKAFKVWSGTQADYDALEVKPQNTLMLVEDDDTFEKLSLDYTIEQDVNIETKIKISDESGVQSEVGSMKWAYKKSQQGICELWGFGTLTMKSLAAVGNAYFSELFYVEFPFEVKDRVIVGTADSRCVITNVGSGGTNDYTDLRLLVHNQYTTAELNTGVAIPINLVVYGKWK